MEVGIQRRSWFWATLILSSISMVAVVFAIWELVEYRYFRDSGYVTLHYLYITRGIGSSLLLAFWAAWYVLRQRRHSERELRRSWERYHGLLEASPGAVALYDHTLRVTEWNAAAEQLYGFAKAEVIGRCLPTVPDEKGTEFREFLRRIEAGERILDIETLRRDKAGALIEVQLSLLPFSEATGQRFFLEVTSDIRERVRLRQTLLDVEKLTSMGKMAAGTAHHLNTPLAAMLLRVQMMIEHPCCTQRAGDLGRLEEGIRFCQQFVQRLLEFSRPVPIRKQPEEVARTIESIVSFMAPPLHAKRARVSLELAGADGHCVYADRNQLEALFLILLSNALDAVPAEGNIAVRCRPCSAGRIEIQIADNGSGIAPDDMARIFEPFFSTKGPGKGTGLGLAIARNIVSEHGGSVRLESAPSRGTTAFIELPLWQEAPLAGGEKR